jgi:hypothetical protein
MTNAIVDLLSEAKAKKLLVTVFVDPSDQSRFIVGYVDALTSREVRIKAVSPFGEDAGYEVRRLNNVFRVDFGGRYERKLTFLAANSSKIFREVKLPPTNKDESLIFLTLKQAHTKKLMIAVWTMDDNDGIVGYVSKLSQTALEILAVDSNGAESGVTLIDLNRVTDMDCNSREEQRAMFLNLHWKNKM